MCHLIYLNTQVLKDLIVLLHFVFSESYCVNGLCKCNYQPVFELKLYTFNADEMNFYVYILSVFETIMMEIFQLNFTRSIHFRVWQKKKRSETWMVCFDVTLGDQQFWFDAFLFVDKMGLFVCIFQSSLVNLRLYHIFR